MFAEEVKCDGSIHRNGCGHPIIYNAFYLSDTHGLPLSVILETARQRGAVVSIPAYYCDALAARWSSKTALARIEEALIDAGQSVEYVSAVKTFLTSRNK